MAVNNDAMLCTTKVGSPDFARPGRFVVSGNTMPFLVKNPGIEEPFQSLVASDAYLLAQDSGPVARCDLPPDIRANN